MDFTGMCLKGSPIAIAVLVLLSALLLAGCSPGRDDIGSYPQLSTVPSQPRPSLPIEERRKIVRDLIEERDASRRQTAVVRSRSGLSTSDYGSSRDGTANAETIIPDEPADQEVFTLRGESEDNKGSEYRSGAQFDDGSLDDFIRQLERDTNPGVPNDPGSDDALTDETSFHLFDTGDESASVLILAGFAPAIMRHPQAQGDPRVRLAANGDEPGFVCRWLGWAVGWSGACTRADQEQAEQSDQAESVDGGEDNTTAEIEEETSRLQQERVADREPSSDTASPSRRSSGEAAEGFNADDASDAIEDLGRGTLAPVKSSLEKLRDFMRARRSTDPETLPADRRSLGSRGDAPTGRVTMDRPPIPSLRPRVRDDITIEDAGEAFEFRRLPPPAFKPTAADEPVILPAPAQSSSTSIDSDTRTKEPVPASRVIETVAKPHLPAIRPKDFVQQTKNPDDRATPSAATEKLESMTRRLVDGLKRAQEESLSGAEPKASDQPPATAALTPPSIDEPQRGENWLPPQVIDLEPGSSNVTAENMAILDKTLAHARANGQKIQIIGEAGTTKLALRRATEIGAALVRLSATAEILEYDFSVVQGVDRVRLVIIPSASIDDPDIAPAG
ncbi:MAG: hypothetical protein AAFO01_05275 [Pseudomonadota bacterium]